MDPSQGEKTTMDRETMDPSQGEKTIDLIPKAKGFLEGYFSTWAEEMRALMRAELSELAEKRAELAEKRAELAEKRAAELEEKTRAELEEKTLAELAEKTRAELVNLYREDSRMNFGGEIIQGKESIRAKLTSLKPSRIQVLNIECLPVGGTGFFGGTGFDSGTGFNSGGTGFSGGTGLQGVASGCIWLDGKLDFCHFSQMFVLHPTPEGSFDISRSIFLCPGI